MSNESFGVVDYIIFALVLLCSSLIGIYFAYKQRKNASSAEYLVASRSLGWFPIFVSQLATFFSAIGIMGFPAQIYSTGITFWFITLSFLLPFLLCSYVFGPMFRKMEVVSVNEYLEKRFSVEVRILSAVFYLFRSTVYLSVALYTPSLALESVAGVPKYVTILATGVVCTFYTSLGGMRAVIWTDVFQSAIMFTGLITTVIVGVKQVGSISEVMDFNTKMDRLSVDFSFDLRHIHTVWGVIIGMGCSFMSVWTVTQPFVQRFIAAKSLREAQKAMFATFFGIAGVVSILAIDALVIFAVYGECDLIKSQKIQKNDQIFPYFVIDKLGHLTGIPGLFTACLFSFSLSTLSSGLNGMSAVLLEDFSKKLKPNLTEKQGTIISKFTAIAGGVIVTVLAFAAPYFGKYIVRIVIEIIGVFGGPMFSVFALGMFTKTGNKFGVMIGAFTGASVGMFFSIGRLIYPPKAPLPPISIRGCTFFNTTIANYTDGIIYRKPVYSELAFEKLFSISYVWNGVIPLITSLLLGCFVSKCTSRYVDKKVDETLLFDWKETFMYRKLFCRQTKQLPIYKKNILSHQQKQKDEESPSGMLEMDEDIKLISKHDGVIKKCTFKSCNSSKTTI